MGPDPTTGDEAPFHDPTPPRAKRTVRSPRVPEPGHDRPQRVGDETWARHNRRRDTADGLADDQPPVE